MPFYQQVSLQPLRPASALASTGGSAHNDALNAALRERAAGLLTRAPPGGCAPSLPLYLLSCVRQSRLSQMPYKTVTTVLHTI